MSQRSRYYLTTVKTHKGVTVRAAEEPGQALRLSVADTAEMEFRSELAVAFDVVEVISSPSREGSLADCGLRGVAWPVVVVAEGDGEHCSKVRLDEIQNGTSYTAKQRQGYAT